MEGLDKIIRTVQGQRNLVDKNTIKPTYHPNEIRVFFVQVLDKIILEKSKGFKGLEPNPEILKAIDLICQYLNNEKEFLSVEGRSFSKGLWLYGSFGSGKTALISAYREAKRVLFNETVGLKTCVDMNDAFMCFDVDTNERARYQGIQKFASKIDIKEKIFDDLGAEETTVQDYGNKLCIMNYILTERHKGYPSVKTHVTTNLTRSQVDDYYGGRLESRMYEMFNIIKLGGSVDSIDHRKN